MKNCIWYTAVAAALLTLSAGVAGAQVTELRFAHWLPEPHPHHQRGFKVWAESVQKASGNSIRISFFPAQQLGSAADHHDLARDGIADLAWTNMSYQPGRFPIAGAGEKPFLISEPVAGSAAYHEWYSQYAERELKDTKLCLVHLQPLGALHSKKSVTHPGQARGMTIRPPSANVGRFFAQLGATNVQVSAPESREALARGTADALGFPWDSIYTFGIDQVVSHHLDMPLYVNVFGLMMNQASYNRLSAEQKAVIDQHCSAEWASKIMSGWNENNVQARQRFIDDPKHTVATPTADELKAWIQAAEAIQQSWAADVRKAGYDAEAMWTDLEQRLRKANALYE
ncbi:MAG TPA: TRAP transporter substrate-binding protein [Gammaproteobacteria bacterium]|nr:TRAP transporter substrate-binding protein [Gammaproteobacteria bacterium]